METWRITILGDSGVGKTALAVKAYAPTKDPDMFQKQIVVDNRLCSVDITDTAGEEEFGHLRDQWIREGQAFILVYSITSRASFQRVKEVCEATIDDAYSTKAKHIPPIVIVGNKLDRHREREVSREEGRKLAKKFRAAFMQTSALTGRNVPRILDAVVMSLRKRQTMELLEKEKGKCVIM